MKVIDTEIPDIDINNLNEQKVNLMNQIIEGIYPLLENSNILKQNQIKNLEEEIKKNKKLIKSSKLMLTELFSKYTKKKKINQLYECLSKLVSHNNITDKHETIILLRVVETLSNEKLDYHLYETIKLVNKSCTVLND
jgi:hypothetical protein